MKIEGVVTHKLPTPLDFGDEDGRRLTAMEFAEAPRLTSERLTLRGWRRSDLASYEAMGADPEVMRYFPSTLTPGSARDHVEDLQDRWRRWGFGYWAIETAEFDFAGFVGLSRPKFDAHFTPCVELGWRLRREAWGRGYASEGARTAERFGFETFGLDEIVAIISVENAPSRRVAERIGMTRDPADDFTYPGEPFAHAECVLYRLTRPDFTANPAGGVRET